MAWVLLRTTADLTDDADFRGLALGDPSTLTLDEMIASGRIAGSYNQAFQGLMDVRVQWIDVSGDRVPTGGSITVEPVYLDDLMDRVFSVGEATVSSGYTPLQLSVPEVGFMSVRVSNMIAPATTTQAQVWVYSH